jgi:carbon storage regulator
MLILSRKLGESIVIDGRITVKIVRLEGDIVKLGIDAPLEVPVHRQEVYDEIQRNNREALAGESANVPTLSSKSGTPPVIPASQPGKVTTPQTRGLEPK